MRSLRVAFVLSGVAGLTYEVLWSRYLSLFVGHSAYAQVLVLAVYLGGMAIGAMVIARPAEQVKNPLRWYAVAEGLLALSGVLFHWVYVGLTSIAYDVLFPGVADASVAGAVRWALAGGMILPQAMVLGATFPLMAAGLVRRAEGSPGGAIAQAYFLNTIGGAAGVLLAGFLLIGRFGLPGTSVVAAAMNATAAALVLFGTRRMMEGSPSDTQETTVSESPAVSGLAWSPGVDRLSPVLLVVAFGTAVASFAYEIGWIRMLSLVLGAATHAFELMLSAFILGIALGALVVRRVTDRSPDPVRLLARIQVGMGVLALLSLPVYLATFDVVAAMVSSFSGRPAGYELYNLGRYGLCLLVMLPATILAGTTLPVVAGSLVRAGAGERTIGLVYGVNTIGAVMGAGLAGLIGLPFLGLKGLVIAGCVLDIGLGVMLYGRSSAWAGRGHREMAGAGAIALIAVIGVTSLVRFDPVTVAGGVFRSGQLPSTDNRVSLYYQDGRTATVSAHLGLAEGLVVLATNGKPDASMSSRWMHERRDTVPVAPVAIGRDFTTQVLAPMVGLAHRPNATSIANIGHGSGMTGAALLTSPSLERLVTIEIEPLMVEGSLVFMPANEAAFVDPRAAFVFDDAKSYFAYRPERFDVIFAEPSNPWVSGVASLFSREFYEQAATVLAEGGVFTQWMQLYEIDDDLFLTIVAALSDVFPYFRAYFVGDGDVSIVASLTPLEAADWSVLESRDFARLTLGAPAFRGQHLRAQLLFDDQTLGPVLRTGVTANSDFHPRLDTRAERSRFEERTADGVLSFAFDRVDVARQVSGFAREDAPFSTPPARGLTPSVLTERGRWLRNVLDSGGGISPGEYPAWQNELVALEEFMRSTRGALPVGTWLLWAQAFVRVENAVHWRHVGRPNEVFYEPIFGLLESTDPQPEARAVVELYHGYVSGAWARVAGAADLLVDPVSRGERWVPPSQLLDLAVLSYLEVGRPDAAAEAMTLLTPLTGRDAGTHLRLLILEALVREALEAR